MQMELGANAKWSETAPGSDGQSLILESCNPKSLQSRRWTRTRVITPPPAHGGSLSRSTVSPSPAQVRREPEEPSQDSMDKCLGSRPRAALIPMASSLIRLRALSSDLANRLPSRPSSCSTVKGRPSNDK